jgi:coiled-coil domain-containing protein 12
MSSNAALSAATDERKARLAKLRSLKRKAPEDERPGQDAESQDAEAATSNVHADDTSNKDAPSTTQTVKQDVTKLYLSGRNYDRETRGPKLGFDAPPNLAGDKPTLEEQAADLEDEVRKRREEEAKDDKGIDLFKLQPKKPNWDLKRELARKMEVLNVRTDNAIAKLVRERLAAKKEAALKARGGTSTDGQGDGEIAGLEGAELVEGVRLREQEEREEERREREDEDLA